jgi:hypothetical protein
MKKRLLQKISNEKEIDNTLARIPFLNLLNSNIAENLDNKISFVKLIFTIFTDILVFVFINITLAIIIMKIN